MSPTVPDPTPFSNTAGAAAFWLFMAVVIGIAMLRPLLRRREAEKTVRLMVEKGQSIDPTVLDRLLQQPERPVRSEQPEVIVIIGLAVAAAGAGMVVMGYLMASRDPDALPAMVGSGVLVGFVGVALIGGGLWRLRRLRRGPTG